MSEDNFTSEDCNAEKSIGPTVLRSDGTVHILIEAAAAQSLFETIKSAGLIAAPPVLNNYHDLIEEFQVEPRQGESCLVVSDPDHRIADILTQWRINRP